jgi:Skp family chaperone for outer membrane proteins
MTSVTTIRQPQPVAMRGLSISVPEPQYARLVEMARKAGRTPAAYAADLFQAAYSARAKPTGDAALDAAVAGLGTPAQGSGPMVDMLQAELERMRAALARADARIAEMAKEIETLRQKLTAQAEAAAQWKAQAMEREQDWCDASAERDIARREAAELQQVRDQQAAAIRELMARVDALKNGHDARSAAPAAVPVSAPQALTSAQLRQARALRAAGNSLSEIAAALGHAPDVVRAAMGAR